jgi:sortase A
VLDEADPDRVRRVDEEPEAMLDDAEGDGSLVAGSVVTAPSGGSRRPSRFDRPRPPHDWRWVVGGVGRVLIAIGVLMLGFVAYQLWGTALQTAAAQNRLENDFEDLMQSRPTLPSVATTAAGADPGVTTGTTAASVPVGATTAPPATTASADPVPPTTTLITVPITVAGTTAPPAAPLATAPPSPIPTPEPLEIVARIEVPEMGVDDFVVQGVTRSALRKGPGHFPETPLPGQLGNAAIAGHRTTYGAPFSDIDRMEPGDDIIVTVPGAGTYYYVTDSIRIVAPEDYGLVMPGDPDVATLILVSCHPKYTTSKRMIVHATLDASRSNLVTQPSPIVPVDSAGQLPGEDAPATPAPPPTDFPAPLDTTAALGGTTAAPAALASGAASERVVLTAGAAVFPIALGPSPPQQDGGTADDGEDAFSAGWFSDSAAWPQVAGWGLLLTFISLGAYWVSFRTRRNWIGALVGIVPFVVALYFFYENVNRLLPPAL